MLNQTIKHELALNNSAERVQAKKNRIQSDLIPTNRHKGVKTNSLDNRIPKLDADQIH